MNWGFHADGNGNIQAGLKDGFVLWGGFHVWVWWAGNIGRRPLNQRGLGRKLNKAAACEINEEAISKTESSIVFGMG